MWEFLEVRLEADALNCEDGVQLRSAWLPAQELVNHMVLISGVCQHRIGGRKIPGGAIGN